MGVKFVRDWGHNDPRDTLEFNFIIFGISVFDLYYYAKYMAGIIILGVGIEWQKDRITYGKED